MTHKKPLRRLKPSDVRFSRWNHHRVVAAPIWAYDAWWHGWTRNAKAWAGIIASVKPQRRHKNGPPWAPYGSWRERRTCPVCESVFFGQGRVETCTDRCAKEQRKKTHRHSKQPRKVEHQPQACQECGEQFTPKRSAAKFCSPACRQSAYRERL